MARRCVGGAAPRRRQAADRGGPARRRPRDLHRPRLAGAELAREVLGRLRASERLRELRGGAGAKPPAPRLPRARATAAVPACGVRLSARLLAGGGRRHAAVGRRPAGDARETARRRRSLLTCGWRSRCSRTRWSGAHRAPARPVRGDELAAEIGIAPGPRLGELLEVLLEARYAGDITAAARR